MYTSSLWDPFVSLILRMVQGDFLFTALREAQKIFWVLASNQNKCSIVFSSQLAYAQLEVVAGQYNNSIAIYNLAGS